MDNLTKITFLGTGNASVPPVRLPGGGIECAWQSNLLLETARGSKMLLDCGTDIRFSMAEAGLRAFDLDAVYISHIHADHIGGMESLAFSTYAAQKRLILYVVAENLEPLRASLMPGLSLHRGKIMQLEDYFEIVTLESGDQTLFQRSELYITPVRALHVPGKTPKWSHGLSITSVLTNGEVFWTSDSVMMPEWNDQWYYTADIILQDCQIGPPSSAHAHLDELRTLPDTIKRKMVLYHHDPALAALANIPHGEFRGLARKGQVISF